MSERRSSVVLPGSTPEVLPEVRRDSGLASMQSTSPNTKTADWHINHTLAFSHVISEGPNREVLPGPDKPKQPPLRKRLKRVIERRIEPKFPNRTVMCPICTYLVPVPEAGYHGEKDSKVR